MCVFACEGPEVNLPWHAVSTLFPADVGYLPLAFLSWYPSFYTLNFGRGGSTALKGGMGWNKVAVCMPYLSVYLPVLTRETTGMSVLSQKSSPTIACVCVGGGGAGLLASLRFGQGVSC